MPEPLMWTARYAAPAPSNLGVEEVLAGGIPSGTLDGLANQSSGKLAILSVHSPTQPFRIVFDNLDPVTDDPSDGMVYPANVVHRFLTRPETRFFRLFADFATTVHFQVEIIQGTPI